MKKSIRKLLDSYGIKYDEENEMFKWIYINGEKTEYLVSSLGEIYSFNFYHRTKVPIKLKHKVSKNDGYHRVTIVMNHIKYTFTVHRLVATAFIPNPDNKPEVNHKYVKDPKDKSDNSVTNLEWCTRSENQLHSYANGYVVHDYGYASINVKIAHKICKDLEDSVPIDEIMKKYSVSKYLINDIKYGLTWRNVSVEYNIPKLKMHFLSDDDVHHICKLLSEGMTPTEIGKILNLNRNTIYNIKYRNSHVNISKHYSF